MFNLLSNRLIAHDRPRYQLWEQCDIKPYLQRILLDFSAAAVHVDHIRHRLKRIEGNANWQRHDRHWNICVQETVDLQHGKFTVLKPPQCSDIDCHQQHKQHRHDCLFLAEHIHIDAKNPVDQDCHDHQEDIRWLPPCIEKKACRQQKYIFERLRLSQQCIVDHQYDWKKYEQKNLTWEKHLTFPPAMRSHRQTQSLLDLSCRQGSQTGPTRTESRRQAP